MTTPLADPVTIPVGEQVTQLCPALGPGASVVIYNNDLTNVAYAGYRNNGLAQSNAIPVQPLGSVTLSAARALYAFCPTATVFLSVAPGGTNISPSPAQIAEQLNALGLATSANQLNQETAIPANIATTGAPLLNAPNLLDSVTGGTITHGSDVVRPAVSFNQPAYDIVISAEIGAGATQAWLQVTLGWIDTNTSFAVSEETFYMAVTNSGVNIIGGRGQTKGDQLSVTFTNLDTAATITYTYSVVQNSRIPPYSDWRQIAFNGISAPVSTTAPGDIYSGVLLNANPTVGAGSNIIYILPMFSGQVQLALAEASQACRFVIRNPAVAANIGGSVLFVFDSGAVAASGVVNAVVPLPRANCQLELLNTSGSSGAFVITATVKDY